MQIKLSTDYALRVIMHIAKTEGTVTSKELSEILNIPHSLIFKICKKLGNAGIIKITTGVQGGFSMQKSPAEISMFDIMKLFEPTLFLNRCLEDHEACSRCATNTCPAHCFFAKLQQKMEKEMRSTSVQDLIENKV